MRLKTAIALLALLVLAHTLVDLAWIGRIPAPEKTFHDHDLNLVRHPLVFRGEYWARALPIAELVPPEWPGFGPYDLFEGALKNGLEGQKSYRTLAPIHYVLSSVPAVLLGIRLETVRMGPVLVLMLLLLAAFDLGRQLGGRQANAAGLLSAALLSFAPVAWMGALIGSLTLGNMTGTALALVALVRCDGFRRWGWSILAGLLVALSTRWGESAGDALRCLAALAGPVALAGGAALVRIFSEKEARGLGGLLLFGLVLWQVIDLPWLSTHLQLYVLPEAGLEADAAPLGPLLPRLWENLGGYGVALWWSLLGPPVLLSVGLGILALLPRLGRSLPVLLLLSSPLSGLVALSLSAKGQDYYAGPVVPALAVLGGAGLLALPLGKRIAPVMGLVAGLSWLVSAHADTAALSRFDCSRIVRTWIIGNPTRCDPRGAEERIYPWFRHWRSRPGREVRNRRTIGDWLVEGEGADWLDSLEPGSLVLLQVPPGPGGGADVVQLIGQSRRPDVLFHRLEGGMDTPLSLALLKARPQAWVVTFVPQMHNQQETWTERPIAWAGRGAPGPSIELLATFQLSGEPAATRPRPPG